MIRLADETPKSLQKVKIAERRNAELVRSRLELLAGEDRVLMTLHLENGSSIRQLAALAGVNPGCMARRVRKIADRLTRNAWLGFLRNGSGLTGADMALARDYFFNGVPLCRLADKHCVSLYLARKTIRKIRALLCTKPGTHSPAPAGDEQ